MTNTHLNTEEKTAINWPTSKGDPVKPVWSYGGKNGLSQTEALRAFAHDLVAVIKEFELPLQEAMREAGGDGLSAYPYIRMLTKRINGLESANIDLRASLRREENARKVLAGTNQRLVEGDQEDRSRAVMTKNQLPKSAEVVAYEETWRIFKETGKSCFEAATVGDDPKYLENRLRLAFEVAWNGAMNWMEGRTLKEIKNDK